MVTLAPPVVDRDRATLMRDGAVVEPRLHHVALIPHDLGPRLHGAAAQPVLAGAGGEGQVERDGRGRVVFDVQADGAVGLGDVNAYGAHSHGVGVTVIRPLVMRRG